MDVRNCKTCGRLFNYLGGPAICPACQGAIEEKFREVKNYIEDHPHAPVAAVAEDNDVSVKQIKQWIREERLAFADDSVDGIECENCGKMIRTGRFCEACKNSMANEMRDAFEKPKVVMTPKKKEKDGNKMRFLQS